MALEARGLGTAVLATSNRRPRVAGTSPLIFAIHGAGGTGKT
ncbi:hypothetical protein [Actinokineospora cianjurensis]|nr:hypothetical protein [Actinokineospora cianjurensis]